MDAIGLQAYPLREMRLSVIVPATDRPPTLPECLRAIGAAEEAPEELLVVEEGEGPAAARNEGARQAGGEVLVFVDADVLPHPNAFARIRKALSSDPQLAAVFGSYDDDPPARGVVSAFRNLLHHHVHQRGAGPATTFWAGLGAVRREAFEAVGGFDEQRYRKSSVEDIDLGLRLTARGFRVRLDPDLLGRHLKRWTLRSMVATDLWRRGVPWVALTLRHRQGSTALNLGWRHRASALLALGALAGAAGRRPALAGGALAAFVALNVPFYALLLRRRGPVTACVGVGLHLLHHLTATLALPLGVALYLQERRRADAGYGSA